MPFSLNGLAHTLYYSILIQVKHIHIRVQAWVLVSLICLFLEWNLVSSGETCDFLIYTLTAYE